MSILTVSQELKDLFKNNNIYFSCSPDCRLKDGEKLHVPGTIQVEPYSAFLAGSTLWSMGSFPYSWSSFPLNRVTVGRYCSIAAGVSPMGIRHPIERFTSSSVTYDGIFEVFQAARRDRNAEAVHRPLKPQGSIRIENDVWIGAQVTLKPGIKVGNGAVIGMKAVVTKDVPPYAIVGGIPAKVIKYRFPDSVISDLLDLAWWKYNCFDFNGFSFDQPIEVFVEYLKEHIRNNAITEYRPKSLGASDLEKAAR